MGDLVKRATADVVASAAGGTVGPVVTALMATAAAVTHNPDLVVMSIPAGALADALTEKGVQLVAKTLLDPADKVARLAEAIGEESGQQAEDFIDEHVTDATHREFLGHVVDAATAARSDWKIRVLARAFVRGVKDGDRIDETEMFVKVTRHLEPAHVRVLSAAIAEMSDAGKIYVTTKGLREHDAKIGPAAAVLWQDLKDQGMITDFDTSPGPDGMQGMVGSRQVNEGFRPSDLGYAVGEWLETLDAEPTDLGSE